MSGSLISLSLSLSARDERIIDKIQVIDNACSRYDV